MTQLSVEIAQAKLDELIDSLDEGDVVILTRNEQPVAKLVGNAKRNGAKHEARQPGSAIGKLVVLAEDDEHLQDFEAYMP